MAALYLDEDVRHAATEALTRLGHQVTHANDHRKGAKDDVQLLIAADAGWILVTCNRKDYVLLHDAWHHWSRRWSVAAEHAGILIVGNTWPAELIGARVHAFLAPPRQITNRLYRWIDPRGWVEHVPPPL